MSGGKFSVAENRAEYLARLQHWHAETNNPLYAWEAIACCLNADDPIPIPDWCLDYLRSASINIFRLSRHQDFRVPDSPAGKLSTEQVIKLIPEALALSKQGHSAFASLLKDRDIMRDANSVLFYGEGAIDEVETRRNVSKDRAKRIVAKGKRLTDYRR
jgi:hypothetical protein